MVFLWSPYPSLALVLLATLLPLTWSLKFDITGHSGGGSKYERCIRNHVAKETLVVVTAIVSGSKGDGQMVSMHVSIVSTTKGKHSVLSLP
jgi:hypothetical protein